MEEEWIVQALVHLSFQLRRLEEKVNILLQHSGNNDPQLLALARKLEKGSTALQKALDDAAPPKVPPHS